MGDAFTIPLGVEDLAALMDEEGIQDAILVGHSNGTYVAQEMVFRHPERVRALVIADGTCITWSHSAFEKFLVNASPALMNLYPYETLKKASLPYASDQPEVQRYMYEAFSRLTKKDFITIWTGVTRCLHAEPNYRIPKPFLLTHGDDDVSGDVRKIAPKWAAREPNCTYKVIANAGHFAILDQPEAFARLVLDYLDRFQD
jgi:pimeloyl-ACP methyl ester carboxylesterase